MNIEIKKNIENKLLKRKEILAYVEDKDPSIKRFDIRAQLAKKLKADEKLIIIEKITPHFGKKDVDVLANVYDTQEALNKVTSKHLVKRNTPKAVEEAEA